MPADVSYDSGIYQLGQTLGVPGGVCVVVLRAAEVPGHLTCRGQRLVEERPPACSRVGAPVGADLEPGAVMWDPITGFEVRCTQAGHGPLVFAGRPMARRP